MENKPTLKKQKKGQTKTEDTTNKQDNYLKFK